MNLRRISAILIILCMTLAVCGGTPAANAADYPSRTIRIIVPFAAGGSTDLTARVLAEALSSRLGGVDVIVENRSGGGGAPGVTELLRVPPDGYTFILASQNAAVLTPILSDVGYTNEDLAPVAQVAGLPTNVFVKADSEIQTVADLVRMAEENYGKMTYSTSGTGSLHHLVAELFQHAAGKKGLLTHVPFEGGPESLTAVLGGHVDIAFTNVSYGENYVKNQGLMRVLVTSSEDGCNILPDVPTFKSLGYDVAISSWWSIFARAGTPAEILDKMDEAIGDALSNNPEIIEAFDNFGMTAAYMNRTDFTVAYLAEYDQLKDVLADIF